jgi:uncharacterized protein
VKNIKKSLLIKSILFLLILYPILLVVFYVFQNQIIFHEQPLAQNFKYHFPIPKKEIWITAKDDTKINALYFYSDSATRKGIICYFHGNADNLARWGKYAGDFTKNGFDVLMIDYRGFGKTKGDFSEKGLLLDAEAAYDFCKGQFPESKIVVYGRSLGSGIATQIAVKHSPKQLLLETPYFNFPDVAYHFLPIFPFHALSNFQFSTDQYINKVICPIHLFHGTADALVYYESSLKLCKILGKNPKEMLTTIVGGSHKNLSDFPEYHIALGRCLEN